MPEDRPIETSDLDRTARPRYESFFDGLFRLLDDRPAYVCFLTADHAVRYGNRRFRETIGQPETEPCHRLLLGRDEPCTDCPPFRALDSGQPQTWEWTSPAGATYHAHAYVFRDLDGVSLALEMGVDISERKRVEDALRDSEQRHRRLAEENAQLAETKARLLQEVNHRVKNNLSAIIGLLHARRGYAPPAEQPVYRRIIEEVAGSIRGMAAVHRMLSEAEWQNLSLHALAGEIAASAAHSMGAPGQVDVAVQGDAAICVTPKQASNLALAINELVTNSLKHAGSAQHPGIRIRIDVDRRGEAVALTYRDDGPGYPADVLTLARHNTGLFLVKMVAASDLGGSLRLTNDGGAVTEICFKGDCDERHAAGADPGAGG